jgi:hypothetical protein
LRLRRSCSSRQRSRRSAESKRDFLGRRLSTGDVVIYAMGRSPLRSGVVLRFDGRGGVWIRIVKRSWHGRRGIPGTIYIQSLCRVVAVPHALRPAVARRLRKHVSRPPRPVELRSRALRAAGYLPERTSTPEMTLIEVGISDACQAEYQRKMSMLLAGHRSNNVTSESSP